MTRKDLRLHSCYVDQAFKDLDVPDIDIEKVLEENKTTQKKLDQEIADHAKTKEELLEAYKNLNVADEENLKLLKEKEEIMSQIKKEKAEL